VSTAGRLAASMWSIAQDGNLQAAGFVNTAGGMGAT